MEPKCGPHCSQTYCMTGVEGSSGTKFSDPNPRVAVSACGQSSGLGMS